LVVDPALQDSYSAQTSFTTTVSQPLTAVRPPIPNPTSAGTSDSAKNTKDKESNSGSQVSIVVSSILLMIVVALF